MCGCVDDSPTEGLPISRNVAQYVRVRLHEWGLSRVFGHPGDGVGGLEVALEKAKDFMHWTQVRPAEMAAFMASAHAKFTGQPGLCYVTSGPGAIHLLTGLYDAKMDHMTVVAIVGEHARGARVTSWKWTSSIGSPTCANMSWPRWCRTGSHLHRPRGADRAGRARRHLRHHSQRFAESD